jgi:hypothetical protein
VAVPKFADSSVPAQFPTMLTTGSVGTGPGEVGMCIDGGSTLDALQPTAAAVRTRQSRIRLAPTMEIVTRVTAAVRP